MRALQDAPAAASPGKSDVCPHERPTPTKKHDLKASRNRRTDITSFAYSFSHRYNWSRRPRASGHYAVHASRLRLLPTERGSTARSLV
jgi:hypothetical protein